jgi:hypothetical protein
MASESPEVEAGLFGEFEERRAKWAAEQNPVGEAANWALDRAVAASLRIERCERAMDDLSATAQVRARLTWDEDQAIQAATIFNRLTRDPVLASRRLQASLAGVELLIEAWIGLLASLQLGNDWSESEKSRALDLLGVATEARAGRTLIDGPEGAESAAYHHKLALEEIDRLETLRDESLIKLDELERLQAMTGDVTILTKPAKLVLRYEREAWRRYRESMKAIQTPAEVQNETPVVVNAPAEIERPKVREQAAKTPERSFEEERRALQAEAAPYLKEAKNRLAAMGLDLELDPEDEPAWFEELEALDPERRNEANLAARPGPA